MPAIKARRDRLDRRGLPRQHADALLRAGQRLPRGRRCRCRAVGSQRAKLRAGTRHRSRYGDYHDLLAMPEIDVVDLCVPNRLHREIAVAAAWAGKHVICTKPLTAYVGQDLAADGAGRANAARGHAALRAGTMPMLMIAAAWENGVQLMYGENWVYAPSIARAEGLDRSSRAGRFWRCAAASATSGSHSPFSRLLAARGRRGADPAWRASRLARCFTSSSAKGSRGMVQPIYPVAVSAEVGDTSRIAPPEKSYMATGWEDVENWAAADYHLCRWLARGCLRFGNGARRHGEQARNLRQQLPVQMQPQPE